MSITVTIHAETGAEARQKMADLLGGPRAVLNPSELGVTYTETKLGGKDILTEAREIEAAGEVAEARGHNKEAATAVEKPKRGRTKKVDEPATRPLISREVEEGAEPVDGPVMAPEDTPEDQAQDEADEQAETDAGRDEAKPLTRDDLRDAMTEYLNKFTMTVAMEDCPKIIGKALGQPLDPDGKPWRLSTVPDDQASLAAAAKAISDAAAGVERWKEGA